MRSTRSSAISDDHWASKFLAHRWKQFSTGLRWPKWTSNTLSVHNGPAQLKVLIELKHHINYHQLPGGAGAQALNNKTRRRSGSLIVSQKRYRCAAADVHEHDWTWPTVWRKVIPIACSTTLYMATNSNDDVGDSHVSGDSSTNVRKWK